MTRTPPCRTGVAPHARCRAAFWPDPHAYAEAVRTLHTAGVRTATHANGDAAERHALDTVAALGPRGHGAHRIEHIETAPDELLPGFAELGVTACLQPPHTGYTRCDGTDEWSRWPTSPRRPWTPCTPPPTNSPNLRWR